MFGRGAVLRGGWAATAHGDAPEAGKQEGAGGVWSALMWALQEIEVAKAAPVPRAVGASVVPTKVAALVAKWATKVSHGLQLQSLWRILTAAVS